MTTSSHCNTGRTYYPVSISRREHFPSCCSENHNTYAENRKIRSLKFDTGGTEKKLTMGAQLQIIPHKKAPKHF